jgi:hypothetical protein
VDHVGGGGEVETGPAGLQREHEEGNQLLALLATSAVLEEEACLLGQLGFVRAVAYGARAVTPNAADQGREHDGAASASASQRRRGFPSAR